MKITLDGKIIEVNNNKIDTAFEEQKKTISDVIDVYQQNKDMQGLLYFLISWNSITKDLMERALGDFGVEKIQKLLEQEG